MRVFHRVPPCPPCVPCCVCFSAVCRNVHELCAHEWRHLFNARAPASSPIHRPFRYPSAIPIPTPCEPAQPPPSPDCLGKIWRRLHHLPRLAESCEDRSGPSKARMWSLAVRLLPQGYLGLLKGLSIYSRPFPPVVGWGSAAGPTKQQSAIAASLRGPVATSRRDFQFGGLQSCRRGLL